MLLKINPNNPQERLITKAVEILEQGGVLIYPTDTVYGLGCDIQNKKAIEKVCRIKGIKPEKSLFSCICSDVSIISDFATGVSTPVYKLMKRALPGPYTFVLQASKNIPRHFQSARKTVGIRVPAHNTPIEIVRALGRPILSTSLRVEDPINAYPTDAELIHEEWGKLVDAVIESGPGGVEPSTVIDCSKGDDEIEVLREGAGPLDILD